MIYLIEFKFLAFAVKISNTPGARFSKAPETFWARKAIFSSSASKNGEVYTLETSCMKRTSVYIKTVNKTAP